MVYSQAKVIAGGLAHIPIVIGVFYFIMTFFNKRAIEYAEANKPKKVEKKVEKPDLKEKIATPTKIEAKVEVEKTTSDSSEIKTCLLYTSPSPRDRYISRMPSSA